MNFTYRIDKANRIIYLEGDNPSLELWRQTMSAVFADPEFETGFSFLSDRRALKVPPSAQFIRAMVNFIKDHRELVKSSKWATVVSTTATFGMGRMAQILSENIILEMQVFTDIEKARQWLMDN